VWWIAGHKENATALVTGALLGINIVEADKNVYCIDTYKVDIKRAILCLCVTILDCATSLQTEGKILGCFN